MEGHLEFLAQLDASPAVFNFWNNQLRAKKKKTAAKDLHALVLNECIVELNMQAIYKKKDTSAAQRCHREF